MVIVPAKPTDIPEPLTIDLKQLLATSRLLRIRRLHPLLSSTLIQRIADRQNVPQPGKIPDAPFQVNRPLKPRDAPPKARLAPRHRGTYPPGPADTTASCTAGSTAETPADPRPDHHPILTYLKTIIC